MLQKVLHIGTTYKQYDFIYMKLLTIFLRASNHGVFYVIFFLHKIPFDALVHIRSFIISEKRFCKCVFSQMACCDSLKYDFPTFLRFKNILKLFTITQLNLRNYSVCPFEHTIMVAFIRAHIKERCQHYSVFSYT